MFIWKSDLAHSSLQFAVSHMVIAEVVGFIRNFEITIKTTKADFSDAKVEAIIDTRSIFTNITDRDQHLMSADFLDSERYPQIRFVSTNFKNIADRKYQATGKLTIKEITLPTIVEVEYTGIQKDPWGNTKAGFRAKSIVRRTSFGLTWNKILDNGAWLIGNDIKMTFQGEFVRQQ
jgi:polyisoprenoid-binding protein YceI